MGELYIIGLVVSVVISCAYCEVRSNSRYTEMLSKYNKLRGVINPHADVLEELSPPKAQGAKTPH